MDTELIGLSGIGDAVHTLESVLKCCSCQKLMKTPVTLWSCDHVFCKACIEHCSHCPMCQLPTWAQDQTENRRLENISLLCSELNECLRKSSEIITESADRDLLQKTCLKRKHAEDYVRISDSSKKIKSSIHEIALKPSASSRRGGQNQKRSLAAPRTQRFTQKNSRGETPLHIAAMQGNVEQIEKILAEKVDVNAKDHAGWSSLHEACNRGHLKVVEKLLDAGALIDIPGYENDTPLIDAVNNNRISVVELLLKKGANVNLRNSDGRTALDLAQTPAMRSAVKSHIKKFSHLESEKKLNISKPEFMNVAFYNGFDVRTAKKLCKLLGANMASDNAASVTHFVVSLANKVIRTFKYLKAMAVGAWIVHDEWVDKCLKSKCWVSEREFVVQGATDDLCFNGPLRSVRAAITFLPRLFDGCHFFLYGNFSSPLPSKKQLSDLITSSGGQILSREPKHDSDIVQACCKVPYHAQPDTPQFFFTNYVVYDPSQKYLPRLVRLGKVCTVPASWVLDCISQFIICDIL